MSGMKIPSPVCCPHADPSSSRRLILYFPVSALVTLFANILQNPQEPRARADLRLMNRVVSFLSMLSTEEENGGVRRMLGVCSEFERIANVVLDKAETESSSKRKRKSFQDEPKGSQQATPSIYSPQSQPKTTPGSSSLFTPTPSVEMDNLVSHLSLVHHPYKIDL